MPSDICVMMSTYNGEKYLKEQLDSILNQECVDVNLLIRDDGSSDNTIEIIESYQIEYPNITLIKGKNEGVIASFMDVLFVAPECSYYAFADQDDVWDKDKLICGIRSIIKANKDKCLYFCKKRIVDNRLRCMKQSDVYVRDTSLGCALLNSVAAGCTMVFDNSFMKILRMYRPENAKISMHDAWIYRVAAAVGIIIYDDEPHMFYRQHGKNVVGADMNMMKLWVHRWKNLFKHRIDNKRSMMAKELIKGYGVYLKKRDLIMLESLANIRTSWSCRVRFIFSDYYRTQKRYEIVFVKIFAILGWL